MRPDIVVDIGNSRIKWGHCLPDVDEMVSLPLDDLNAWDEQADKWWTEGPTQWAVSGVNPKRIDQFLKWQQTRGGICLHLKDYRRLPLRVEVPRPERVGLDRLLGALAAHRHGPQGWSAITVDVGTAVTVNLVDESGAFRGGAIFPGPRLMAQSLHDQTAQLPQLEIPELASWTLPGPTTPEAIQAGITLAIVGGVQAIVRELAPSATKTRLVITGGARGHLATRSFGNVAEVLDDPFLNLKGIRLAAEALS